jgi:hypothetical protein
LEVPAPRTVPTSIIVTPPSMLVEEAGSGQPESIRPQFDPLPEPSRAKASDRQSTNTRMRDESWCRCA